MSGTADPHFLTLIGPTDTETDPTLEYWKGLSKHYADEARRQGKLVATEHQITRMWRWIAFLIAALAIIGLSFSKSRQRDTARTIHDLSARCSP
jgi:hypothetical protein